MGKLAQEIKLKQHVAASKQSGQIRGPKKYANQNRGVKVGDAKYSSWLEAEKTKARDNDLMADGFLAAVEAVIPKGHVDPDAEDFYGEVIAYDSVSVDTARAEAKNIIEIYKTQRAKWAVDVQESEAILDRSQAVNVVKAEKKSSPFVPSFKDILETRRLKHRAELSYAQREGVKTILEQAYISLKNKFFN